MKTATGDAVLKAYSQAVKKIQKDSSIMGTEVSAGFIIPDGQKRGLKLGHQVFVKIRAFSQIKLKHVPESGGLL